MPEAVRLKKLDPRWAENNKVNTYYTINKFYLNIISSFNCSSSNQNSHSYITQKTGLL